MAFKDFLQNAMAYSDVGQAMQKRKIENALLEKQAIENELEKRKQTSMNLIFGQNPSQTQSVMNQIFNNPIPKEDLISGRLDSIGSGIENTRNQIISDQDKYGTMSINDAQTLSEIQKNQATNKPKKVMTQEEALKLGQVPKDTEIIKPQKDTSPEAVVAAFEGKERVKQMIQKPKATAALKKTIGDLDSLKREAQAIMSDPALGMSTGMLNTVGISKIPGTPMRQVTARLKTLRSKIGFGVLQNMREMSKTGGALGNVSEKENELLQENLSTLDQSLGTDDFKQSLQRIIDYVDESQKNLNDSFVDTYGSSNDNVPINKNGGISGKTASGVGYKVMP